MSKGTPAAPRPSLGDISRLVDALTLDERLRLCTGHDFWHTFPVERIGIPTLYMNDGPHGVRATKSSAIFVTDNAPSTCFPTQSALAASWDPQLVGDVAAAIGHEARAHGVGMLLAPGLNLKRSPLGGRNFEYFSEDPYLTGMMAAAYVSGLQSTGVAACVKHFVCNDQERERMTINTIVDERALWEVYLQPFAMCIELSRPRAVMAAYNRVNGEKVTESSHLLQDTLRGRLGFDGVIVSDWGAIDSPEAAMKSGVDLEMPPDGDRQFLQLKELVESGAVSIRDIDERVARILRLVLRQLDDQAVSVDFDEHYGLARRAAADGTVLLANNGVLPLPIDAGRIGVVGSAFRSPRVQGGGSSEVLPERVVSPEAALATRFPDITVDYALGDSVDGDCVDESRVAAAVEVAARNDVTLVFVGLPASAESEGRDRDSYRLSPQTHRLVEEMAQSPTQAILVLVAGTAVEIPQLGSFSAVLHAGLLGAGVGDALVDVLWGEVDPSGRLAETYPRSHRDLPVTVRNKATDSAVVYGESVLVGHRYYDDGAVPVAFPFGHGLSYTSFEYSSLSLSATSITGDDSIDVSFSIRNAGSRWGRDVAQLYVEHIEPSVVKPVRTLRRFAKVSLEPGESTTVSFRLGREDFHYLNDRVGSFLVEPGDYVVHVGASSRDIRSSADVAISLSTGDAVRLRQSLNASSPGRAFCLVPETRAAYETALSGLDDALLKETLLDMPLSSIHRLFPDLVSREAIDELLDQVRRLDDESEAPAKASSPAEVTGVEHEPRRVAVDVARFDAVVFDMDGVVTETTAAHRAAWKAMFDAYLQDVRGPNEPPFDDQSDYLRFVDGKPRYDGVRSFLASRGIALPEGEPADAPSVETVCGLGNRKNEIFNEHIASSGVDAYASTVRFIRELDEAGVQVALITSSRNADQVLRAAGVDGLFEVVIDGEAAARQGLPGKPEPAVFLAAAEELGVVPDRAVVVEDALAGVTAGKAGGFGLVIGVARADNAIELGEGGADVVVADLADVAVR